MVGYHEYLQAMLGRASKAVKKINEEHFPELSQVFANRLFNLPGARYLSANPSPEEIAFGELFSGFSEIGTSYDTLKALETLPLSGVGFSEDQCIQINVECYLNEVYVLQERLFRHSDAVCAKALKLARTNPDRMKISALKKSLRKIVFDSLKPFSDVRNSHIHDGRFVDEDMTRVRSMHQLVNHGSPEMKRLTPYYERCCQELRSKWAKMFCQNNCEVCRLLDIYCEALYQPVFGSKGILG